jgi:hypothetical protein
VQVDFAQLGMLTDAGDGRRRVVHGFAQTLEAIVVGCEAACTFFGGVFRVVQSESISARHGGRHSTIVR